MTASPAPGMPSELFAESARNSGELPSEEMIARAICADDFDFDETVYDTLSPRQQSQFLANARAILSLIRPAFEAKEREIERLQEAAEYWPETSASWEARALSAEAKLAQAVEALGRAKDEIVRTADDLSMNSPAVKLIEDIAAIIGQPALNSRAIVKDALDRARAASNIGQNEGATLATSKDTP